MARGEGAVHRSPEIRELRKHEVLTLRAELQRLGREVGFLRTREKPLRESSLQRVRVTGIFQPLCGVLADRLQHPEAAVRAADEVLVDERLKRVDVCLCNFRCPLEDAAAREDGKPSEQALLLWPEQAVDHSIVA